MRKIRVLILGADRRMDRLIHRLVERTGFESLCVMQPEKYQTSYTGFQPDCVFLDVGQTGIDCSEVLNFIAGGNTKTMVIIMGTDRYAGDESPQALGESLGLNMQSPLSDEFNIDDINAKLERIRRVKP